MKHIQAATVMRDFSTGEIRLEHLGPVTTFPGVSILINDIHLSEQEFREKAWDIVLGSLDTFFDRAVAEEPRKPPAEARRAIRRGRELQKRFSSLTILRESSHSLLLQLCKGKRGRWEEVARATIPVPSSNDVFLQALEDLGFFSQSSDS